MGDSYSFVGGMYIRGCSHSNMAVTDDGSLREGINILCPNKDLHVVVCANCVNSTYSHCRMMVSSSVHEISSHHPFNKACHESKATYQHDLAQSYDIVHHKSLGWIPFVS
mmetsp:Transcript_5302/g.7902  ORF Transcript_5302/g.7902 Transcript_5302/m.7902 type:complete len:110 (-) Transcript_5302:340-669(-)